MTATVDYKTLKMIATMLRTQSVETARNERMAARIRYSFKSFAECRRKYVETNNHKYSNYTRYYNYKGENWIKDLMLAHESKGVDIENELMKSGFPAFVQECREYKNQKSFDRLAYEYNNTPVPKVRYYGSLENMEYALMHGLINNQDKMYYALEECFDLSYRKNQSSKYPGNIHDFRVYKLEEERLVQLFMDAGFDMCYKSDYWEILLQAIQYAISLNSIKILIDTGAKQNALTWPQEVKDEILSIITTKERADLLLKTGFATKKGLSENPYIKGNGFALLTKHDRISVVAYGELFPFKKQLPSEIHIFYPRLGRFYRCR